MSILPQALALALKQLPSRLAEAFLPASCLLCGGDSPAGLLCPPCRRDLPQLPATHCPQCAETSPGGERCGQCLKAPPHFEQTVAGWRYDFPLDRLVQALKYGHQLPVANWLGEQLAALCTGDDHDLIVPLPLHPSRLAERGFNQSTEIARSLGRRLGLPVEQHLARIRATSPQAALPYAARRHNVRGAFACTADYSGRNILLVDDVMTTGATLDEAARILKLHGARSICLVVAARTWKHAASENRALIASL